MNDELMNAFQNAWDAFRNDNVDIFYIDGSKMCLVTKPIKRGISSTFRIVCFIVLVVLSSLAYILYKKKNSSEI